MKESLQSQIMELKVAPVEKLQSKYKELFKAKGTPCDNKVYLFKRIAYKLQKLEYGRLSEKAKARINVRRKSRYLYTFLKRQAAADSRHSNA